MSNFISFIFRFYWVIEIKLGGFLVVVVLDFCEIWILEILFIIIVIFFFGIFL